MINSKRFTDAFFRATPGFAGANPGALPTDASSSMVKSMRMQRWLLRSGIVFFACGANCIGSSARPPDKDLSLLRYEGMPAGATRCDPSIPIFVELATTTEPVAGRPARFEARVQSKIDADLVRAAWLEWEVPPRVRRLAASGEGGTLIDGSGRGTATLDAVIPDQSRYSIRARFVVQLKDGKTIAQTAVRWVNLGGQEAQEGLMRRIANPDGTGVRVYQGSTVR